MIEFMCAWLVLLAGFLVAVALNRGVNNWVDREDARLHQQLGMKAPQRQCKDHERHAAHHYEDRRGLVWWCQGRGNG